MYMYIYTHVYIYIRIYIHAYIAHAYRLIIACEEIHLLKIKDLPAVISLTLFPRPSCR